MRPELINASVLAYLGDSIFEVLVRDYLVKESGFVKPNDLQREAVICIGKLTCCIYA